MGQTMSDIHRRMYKSRRSSGLTHEEAIKKFPKQIRSRVEEDANKTFIESHFGISAKVFVITLLVFAGLIYNLFV